MNDMKQIITKLTLLANEAEHLAKKGGDTKENPLIARASAYRYAIDIVKEHSKEQ